MQSDYSRVPGLVKAIGRALIRMTERRVPPAGPEELRRTDELRSVFATLPAAAADTLPPSAAEWAANMTRLRELVLTQDPRTFLRWDVIRRTMFLTHAPYSWTELRYLRSLSDWRKRWSPALREARVGHPQPLPFYPSTSGNLLHHAYHVARFEAATGRRPDQIQEIIEFGGGYGSMCRLFFNLGFRGRYVIFDLPPFSSLQEYYLSSLGIPAERGPASSSVNCLSDQAQLLDHVARLPGEDALFIGTWSLSESPLEVRLPFEPVLLKCSSFLIAFQQQFGEVDNTSYFNRLTARMSDVEWTHSAIPHLPGNSYLFGTRTDREARA